MDFIHKAAIFLQHHGQAGKPECWDNAMLLRSRLQVL